MSLYTKSGFSRNFGCCSHWHVCDMGKKTCVYQEKDPETMENCGAWQRVQKQGRLSNKPLLQEDTTEKNNPVVKEQLTLF